MIRKAKISDSKRLSEVAIKSILSINSHYSKRQLNAWASINTPERFVKRIKKRPNYVFTSWGRIAGIISFEDNEIKNLYVAPEYHGKNIGKQLLEFAETKIEGEIRLRAALNAVGFYKKQGYSKVKDTEVLLGGVRLREIVMKKAA